MKFEKIRNSDQGEPVAYIDEDGDLMIRGSNQPVQKVVGIAKDGFLYIGMDWNPDDKAKVKIYPGDTVEITF